MSGRNPSRSQNPAGASGSRMWQIDEAPRSRSHSIACFASASPASSGRRPSIINASISPDLPARGCETTRAVAIPHSSPSASAPNAAKSSRPDSASSVVILRTVSGVSVPSARSFHALAPSEASSGASSLTTYEADTTQLIVTDARRTPEFHIKPLGRAFRGRPHVSSNEGHRAIPPRRDDLYVPGQRELGGDDANGSGTAHRTIVSDRGFKRARPESGHGTRSAARLRTGPPVPQARWAAFTPGRNVWFAAKTIPPSPPDAVSRASAYCLDAHVSPPPSPGTAPSRLTACNRDWARRRPEQHGRHSSRRCVRCH
jgi:hypothetical protein